MNTTTILGIHIGHDCSAALISNGKIIAAIEEERLVRRKGFAGFPFRAIQEVLEISGIDKDNIDVVSIAGEQLHLELPYWILLERINKLSILKKVYYKLILALSYMFPQTGISQKLHNKKSFWNTLESHIRELGFVNAKIETHDHHLSHAASSFWASPFDKSIVFTLDGKGDLSSGTISDATRKEISTIQRIDQLDSIGQIYAEVTRYLGFRPNRHEGKITGLAAMGDHSKLLPLFKELIVFAKDPENSSRIKFTRKIPDMPDVKYPYKNPKALNLDLQTKIGIVANSKETKKYAIASELIQKWLETNCLNQSREDVAAAIQKATEDWIVEWVVTNLPEEKTEVCLAGGVFANVKVNQQIREQTKVKNVFIQPAMGDSGLSLGAAILSWQDNFAIQKSTSLIPPRHAYLGPEFSENKILSALINTSSSTIEWERLENIEKEIAKLLHLGHIVGRFNGRLEWGPRALGNRSILVNPTDKSINNSLNDRLSRSEFMPFAPSVLDYRAKDYFEGYKKEHFGSEFMTMTYSVFPKMQKDIEAVVHVDGTARPQVVRKEINPSYYEILKEYEKLSGIGVVVNTSFNIHEEPIVAMPEDAIKALFENAIDVLAIGNFIVQRK